MMITGADREQEQASSDCTITYDQADNWPGVRSRIAELYRARAPIMER